MLWAWQWGAVSCARRHLRQRDELSSQAAFRTTALPPLVADWNPFSQPLWASHLTAVAGTRHGLQCSVLPRPRAARGRRVRQRQRAARLRQQQDGEASDGGGLGGGEDLSNTYLVAMSFSINLHHVNNLVDTKVNI